MPTLDEILAGEGVPVVQSIAGHQPPTAQDGSVSMLLLSPALESRIVRAAQDRAIPTGELLSRALDALDKVTP